MGWKARMDWEGKGVGEWGGERLGELINKMPGNILSYSGCC